MEKPSEHAPRFYLAEKVEDAFGMSMSDPLLGCADCSAPVWHPEPDNMEGFPLCPQCFAWRLSASMQATTRGFVLGQ